MANKRALLAICLALTLVFTSVFVPLGWALPPASGTTSEPADGGDGHPWDDGTVEETGPGDDGGSQPIESQIAPYQSAVVLSWNDDAAAWVRRALIFMWRNVVLTKVGYKKAGHKQVGHKKISWRLAR